MALTLTQAIAFLSRWWSDGSSAAVRNSPLRGEALEQRCVPAKYLWSFTTANGTGDWGDKDNWRWQNPVNNNRWEWATQAPGAGDDVVFGRAGGFGGNTDCLIKLNAPVSVISITIQDVYTHSLI